jgi:hypothetical protein
MEKTVLVLRSCSHDMTSRGGFIWPELGPVKCLDWSPRAECGNGLHGLLNGEGDWSLVSFAKNAKWLVVEVNAGLIVHIGGKVKFPSGNVVFCGTLNGAAAFLSSRVI